MSCQTPSPPLHPDLFVLEACSKLGLVLSYVQKPAENFVPPICPCRQMALRSHKRPLENTRPAMGPVGPALAKPAFFARSAGPARLVRAGACSGQVGIKTRHTTKEASLQRDTQSQGRLRFNLPPI